MKAFKHILTLALTVVWMTTPVFADDSDDSTGRDDTQIFHVYEGLDIVSTLKFAYGKPRIVIKAVYPQLETDNELTAGMAGFNNTVSEIVQEEEDQFKTVVAANHDAQKDFDNEDIKNNLYIDYDTSAIKSGKDHILSIRFSMQGYVTGLTHPYHYHHVLNYDLETNQKLELADLFEPTANYLQVLSTYASGVLSKRFPNKTLVADGTAPDPENYQVWNIKPEGLLITFENYQVAPNVYGAQTVLVPFDVLKGILASDSPLASCIEHKKRCMQNNLLTGGFMEVAANKQRPHKKVVI